MMMCFLLTGSLMLIAPHNHPRTTWASTGLQLLTHCCIQLLQLVLSAGHQATRDDGHHLWQ